MYIEEDSSNIGCTGTSITSRLTYRRRLGNGDGIGTARKRPYDFSNNEGTVLCIGDVSEHVNLTFGLINCVILVVKD